MSFIYYLKPILPFTSCNQFHMNVIFTTTDISSFRLVFYYFYLSINVRLNIYNLYCFLVFCMYYFTIYALFVLFSNNYNNNYYSRCTILLIQLVFSITGRRQKCTCKCDLTLEFSLIHIQCLNVKLLCEGNKTIAKLPIRFQ